jgi:hypothetical protein
VNDSRYQRILATLDDLRTEAADLIDELPSTDLHVLALKRVMRHANSDIRLLQAGGRLPA